MRQRWERLLFAHWPVAPQALTGLVPPGVPLDTFEGQAWVGVVPFVMRGVRPRGLPAVPWLSAFAEINVRTYVTLDGKPGVWFFSLDAGNPLAVILARTLFHLPYFTASFQIRHSGDSVEYASRRARSHATVGDFQATYRPIAPVFHATPGTLPYFLTERYCLYTANRQGHLFRCDIRHPPWPLQSAEVDVEQNTLAATAGITLPATPPLLHYARRQDVVVWGLQRVGD